MKRLADRIQVRIGGEAGQGVVLAGVVLARAAVIGGAEVAQSARYGAAVRGGEATSDVVISRSAIDFPHAEEPDLLVAISQPVYDRLAPLQAVGTSVIFDPFFVRAREIEGVRQFSIAATEEAIREFGRATGANVIILGALSEISGIAEAAHLRAALEADLGGRALERSLAALEMGRTLARREADG